MRLANLPRRERESWKLPKARREILRRQLYAQAQADYKLLSGIKEASVSTDRA
jgi:hypothetical protein